MAVAAIAIAFALPAKAQVTPFTYFNVDWQFNAPIAITLQTKQARLGYELRRWILYLPDLSIGAFINYHTNNEYISHRDTTNQQLGSPDNRPATFRISVAFRFRNALSLRDGVIANLISD